MALSLKNISRVPHNVGIILASGKKATVRIMARSKKPVDLAEGITLDPEWLAHNPKIIKLIENTKVEPAKAATQAPIAATTVSTEGDKQ